MKNYCQLIHLIIFILRLACNTPITELPKDSQPNSDLLLFKKAESYFQQQPSYEQALALYSEFLTRFPGHFCGDLVFKRMAVIHGLLVDREAKLDAFRKLISEYLESPYVSLANYEIIKTLHKEGKSKKVLLSASKIIQKSNSQILFQPTYEVLGDTYMSLGLPIDAVFFYDLAYSMADKSHQKNIIDKLKALVLQLDLTDIDQLTFNLNDNSFKRHFTFMVAKKLYENKNYEAAKMGFLDF